MGSWAIEPSSRELTPLDAGEVASGRQSSGPPGLSPWLPQPQCSCPRRLRPFALSSIMMLPAPSRADFSAASCGDPLPLERATASGRRSSGRRAADSSSRPPAGLGRGLPRGATATGGIPGGADLEESFLFPECVQGFGAGTDPPRPAAEAAAAAGGGGATAAAARGGEAAAEVTGRPAGAPGPCANTAECWCITGAPCAFRETSQLGL
ncbi:uncharacterized protein ACBT57_013126 isoform 2-T3 [Dama dama]